MYLDYLDEEEEEGFGTEVDWMNQQDLELYHNDVVDCWGQLQHIDSVKLSAFFHYVFFQTLLIGEPAAHDRS